MSSTILKSLSSQDAQNTKNCDVCSVCTQNILSQTTESEQKSLFSHTFTHSVIDKIWCCLHAKSTRNERKISKRSVSLKLCFSKARLNSVYREFRFDCVLDEINSKVNIDWIPFLNYFLFFCSSVLNESIAFVCFVLHRENKLHKFNAQDGQGHLCTANFFHRFLWLAIARIFQSFFNNIFRPWFSNDRRNWFWWNFLFRSEQN